MTQASLFFAERLELVGGIVELVHDLEDRVGVDAELGERQDLVLVLAPVPAERRRGLDPVELGDLAGPGRSGPSRRTRWR